MQRGFLNKRIQHTMLNEWMKSASSERNTWATMAVITQDTTGLWDCYKYCIRHLIHEEVLNDIELHAENPRSPAAMLILTNTKHLINDQAAMEVKYKGLLVEHQSLILSQKDGIR